MHVLGALPVIAVSDLGLPEIIDRHREVVIYRPARILLILLVAFVVRAIVRRAIRRITRLSADSGVPLVLRPLKERLPVNGLLEGAGLVSERRRQRARTIGSVLGSIASITIMGLAAMQILDELQYNLAPVVASAGVVGVALGFGAQNLVKDFLAGIFMILEDQYGVGDVIDVGEAAGAVEAVGLRTTRMRDLNGTVWYVRNGEIIRVGNKSQGFAQVVLDVPIPYEVDVEAASRAVKEVADGLRDDEDWSDVIIEQPELLGVEEMTEDGIVLRLTVKTRPLQQWRVGRELRRRLKVRFDADGIWRSPAGARIDVRASTPAGGPAPAAKP
jgi:small-conductance mechanosensitive channel